MNQQNDKHIQSIYLMTVVVLMTFSSTSYADYFPFRVAFENIPGVEALSSGRVDEGIEILEQQLDGAMAINRGYILATLCGAYIIDSSLNKAASVCDVAVDENPGETSYNNRGVLRAFTGDFEGAREDFDRARPVQMSDYLDYLKTKDVGLIADGNHELLQNLAAQHSSTDVASSVAANNGAKVQNILQ